MSLEIGTRIKSSVRVGSGVRVGSQLRIPPIMTGLQFWLNPTIGLIESGGNVSSWMNQGLIEDILTPFNADPTLVTINNDLAVHIDENQALQSSASLTELRFLHDGTGCTIYAFVNFDATTDATNVLIDSNGSAPGNTGIFLAYDANIERVITRIGNGTGSYLFNVASGTGSVPKGATYLFTFRCKSGETSEYEVFINKVSLLSGAFTGSPNTGNATYGLYFGGRASSPNTLGLDGSIIHFLAYSSYHDTSMMTAVSDWILI